MIILDFSQMAKILIIFGSTSGNTELIVDHIAALLRALGHEVELKPGETTTFNQDATADHDLTILASPTYGHGALQEYMVHINQQVATANNQGHKFAVIGLGDPKYDRNYNIESAIILENSVKKSGGELIIESLKINKSPIPHLKSTVETWVSELNKLL